MPLTGLYSKSALSSSILPKNLPTHFTSDLLEEIAQCSGDHPSEKDIIHHFLSMLTKIETF